MPKRKDIRLKDYDYSQNGVYFITICVKDKHEMLGAIVGTTALGRPSNEDGYPPNEAVCPFVKLTPLGICVDETIRIANKDNVKIDKYVIMPNHIHMIVVLGQDTDDRRRSSLQQVVRNIKSFVTKWAGFSMWQPRFHDHIIRNKEDYLRIWQYIDENPARWTEDKYYCEKN